MFSFLFLRSFKIWMFLLVVVKWVVLYLWFDFLGRRCLYLLLDSKNVYILYFLFW